MLRHLLHLFTIDDTLKHLLCDLIDVWHVDTLLDRRGLRFIVLILSHFIDLIAYLCIRFDHVFKLFFLICYLVVENADQLILLRKFLLDLVDESHVLVHLLCVHLMLFGQLLALGHGFLELLLHLYFSLLLHLLNLRVLLLKHPEQLFHLFLRLKYCLLLLFQLASGIGIVRCSWSWVLIRFGILLRWHLDFLIDLLNFVVHLLQFLICLFLLRYDVLPNYLIQSFGVLLDLSDPLDDLLFEYVDASAQLDLDLLDSGELLQGLLELDEIELSANTCSLHPKLRLALLERWVGWQRANCVLHSFHLLLLLLENQVLGGHRLR